MRKVIPINFEWYFKTYEKNDEKRISFDDLEIVDIPHQVVELPLNNFNERSYQDVFSYYKVFKLSEKDQGKLCHILCEGILHHAKIYINGHYVGEHYGGYTPFEFEMSEHISYTNDNILAIIVDTKELDELPPFGGVVDYLGYGGIYREVSLILRDEQYIEYLFIEQLSEKDLKIHVKTKKHHGDISLEIKDDEGKTVYINKDTIKHSLSHYYVEIEHPILWDLEHPHLYQLNVKIKDQDQTDEINENFGMRTIEFKKEGFYLNGKNVKLIGLNRHQSYPYVGYAMPKSMQEKDADLLKYHLGVNIVRTSHYPQSKHFLKRCDEIGLLVFEEIPGWQHIGNEIFQQRSLDALKEMILRDRNHPSIIMWGVRINESADHHDFYQKTNELAKSLDPSRPRGGVRNFEKSELLEDVYTYNDFSHTGKNKGLLPKHKVTDKKNPYLVTEYNGHMFPTKRFDDESHRIEHLKRHLNVINEALNPKNNISGAIGWSMFDYHTHKDFGSGDRVCYHGVLDMFRLDKIASLAYQTLKDDEPILEVTSKMHIGDYKGGLLKEVYVMTNLDEVMLYKNEMLIGTFKPDKKAYPHLKHPPIIMTDFIGESLEKNEKMSKKDARKIKEIFKAIMTYGNKLSLKHKLSMLFMLKKYHLSMDDGVKLFFKYTSGWGQTSLKYTFKGYKNEKLMKTVHIETHQTFDLVLTSDDHELKLGDTYDVKQYVLTKVNQHEEIVDYAFDDIKINVSGSIELIGPSHIHLVSGTISFYVKSKEKGIGMIEIESGQTAIYEEVLVS